MHRRRRARVDEVREVLMFLGVGYIGHRARRETGLPVAAGLLGCSALLCLRASHLGSDSASKSMLEALLVEALEALKTFPAFDVSIMTPSGIVFRQQGAQRCKDAKMAMQLPLSVRCNRFLLFFLLPHSTVRDVK